MHIKYNFKILAMIFLISAIVSIFFMPSQIFAQATVTETRQTFLTYPYSDPSPIPLMNNIYPYYRFDGFTDKGENRQWTVVTLENPYIKVLIAPQIGGKVLGAFEKSTGLPFIYFNKVVKFRDIAMRGPWTSGGIEFNFGDIGHAPTTSSAVDYLTRKNGDGSVSCFIGAIDLPSRTEWRVEIRLDPDKSYFETNSFWYNPTGYRTSMYNWSNAAAAVGEDLKYYFPGSHYIGHGGEADDWPVLKSGRDISLYRNNDYGEYHSYHVLGEYTDYFAGMWEKSDFGFGHWSLYSDKPGKKIWIWSLSRQGQIWEPLLTDPELGNTQYTEIQSGLLFNQAGSSSSRTPFKHAFLEPSADQRFSEIWFPIKGTGGIVDANKIGSLNVTTDGKTLKIAVCANQPIREMLAVKIDGMQIYDKNISIKPAEVFRDSLPVSAEKGIQVILGDNLLSYSSDYEKDLSRPILANSDFDWNSAEGLYADATEKARQRDYPGALDAYLKCLGKNPASTGALTGAAEIYCRRMEYDKALEYVKKALSNDAYNPLDNFVYGAINRKLEKLYDAVDGFSIAARSMEYRSGAYLQLAELSSVNGERQKAETFARRALDYNRFNLDAYKMLALLSRDRKNPADAAKILDTLLALDPLNHFARFEKYLNEKRPEMLDQFKSLIRNELPDETYLELSSYYTRLRRYGDALEVLKSAPPHPIVGLWSAYLCEKTNSIHESRKWLEKSVDAPIALIYPFREETAEALKWASGVSSDWKIRYYLGLICWNRGNLREAEKYFDECADLPDYAPFFLTRIILNRYADSVRTAEDFEQALRIDPGQWRTYHMLAKYYNDNARYEKSLEVSSEAVRKFPGSYIIGFDYATSLLYNGQYEKCISVLEKINILPFEGAGYGHDVYRSALVLRALGEYKKGRFEDALAMADRAALWPENLGAGKPYDADNRIEDYIKASCYKKSGSDRRARDYYEKIVDYTLEHSEKSGVKLILAAFAADRCGKKGEELVNPWLKARPASAPARWAKAIIMNDPKAASGIVGQAARKWNPFPEDPEFRLVYEIINTIN